MFNGALSVDISFGSRRLARIFNSEKELVRKFGAPMARKIQTRMAVLKGASNLSLVPKEKPTRRHQLSQDRDEEFAVDLIHPYRLVFVPDHNPIPHLDDGGINVSKVTAVKIQEVVDYH